MRAFLYGYDRDPGAECYRPSLGFRSTPTLIFAEDPGSALNIVDPDLRNIDPLGWEFTRDNWIIPFPPADVLAETPGVFQEDQALSILHRFGWHHANEDQCDLCGEWTADLCPGCALCPGCKGISHQHSEYQCAYCEIGPDSGS